MLTSLMLKPFLETQTTKNWGLLNFYCLILMYLLQVKRFLVRLEKQRPQRWTWKRRHLKYFSFWWVLVFQYSALLANWFLQKSRLGDTIQKLSNTHQTISYLCEHWQPDGHFALAQNENKDTSDPRAVNCNSFKKLLNQQRAAWLWKWPSSFSKIITTT